MQQAILVTRNIKIVTARPGLKPQRGRRNGAGVSCCDNPELILSVNTKPCSWLLLSSARLLEPGCPVTHFRDVLFFGRGCPTSCFWVLMFFCVCVWEPMLEIVATVTGRIFKKNNESTSWPFSPPVWVWFSRSEWSDVQPGLSSTALLKS